MASKKQQHEDAISCCGSMVGETIAWRRNKSYCSLRQHSIQSGLTVLAPDGLDSKLSGEQSASGRQDTNKPRFNESFHHLRLVIVMLGGMSLGFMIYTRINITVAVLSMVNQTALYMEEHPNKTIDDFLDEGYSLGGDFDWNNEIQQMIMSWYMIAYTLPQVAATKIGIKFGCRLTVPISLTICALSTILTPTFAYWGWEYVIGLRLINGFGAAAVLPMMLHLIEHWMPYDQFSLGLTCAQLVQMLMTASCPFVCGYLSAIHWSYAFYVPGIIVLLFCLLWLLLITDRPDESYLISQKELDLICGCARDKVDDVCAKDKQADVCNGKKANNTGQSSDDHDSDGTWLDVIKSRAFYAYIVIWIPFCCSITIFTFILPTYIRQYLKIGMLDVGAYCCLILSGSMVAVIWPHPILRLLERTFHLSELNSRRIVYTIVCSMTAGTWIFVGLHHSYQLLVVLFINRCFQNGNEIIILNSLMTHYSKSGVSSIAFSMINTISNLSLVIISPLVGYILDYTGQSDEGWSWIFYGLGFSQLLMLAVYVTMIGNEPLQIKHNKVKDEKVTFAS